MGRSLPLSAMNARQTWQNLTDKQERSSLPAEMVARINYVFIASLVAHCIKLPSRLFSSISHLFCPIQQDLLMPAFLRTAISQRGSSSTHIHCAGVRCNHRSVCSKICRAGLSHPASLQHTIASTQVLSPCRSISSSQSLSVLPHGVLVTIALRYSPALNFCNLCDVS